MNGPRHSPYYYYLCRAPNIAAVGTIFNVFSYDAVLAQDLNPRRRSDALRVEPRSRVNNKTYTSLPNLPPVTVGAVPEEKENLMPCPLFSRVPAIGVS